MDFNEAPLDTKKIVSRTPRWFPCFMILIMIYTMINIIISFGLHRFAFTIRDHSSTAFVDPLRCKLEALQWSPISGYYLETRKCKWLQLGAKLRGIDDAENLASAMRKVPSTTVRKIELWANKFGDVGIQAVVEAIRQNKAWEKLEELDLTRNKLSHESAEHIASLIRESTSLRQMILYENQLGEVGAQTIAESLVYNTRKGSGIEKLFLEYNNIGSKGATAFANALHKNQSLQHLDLDHNQIGAFGASQIAKALSINARNGEGFGLRHLDLEANNIGNEGAIALANALGNNKDSKNIVHTKITRAGDWGGVLIDHLDIADNNITDSGLIALANMLHQNRALLQLNLKGSNVFSDSGIIALENSLRWNGTIERISFPKLTNENLMSTAGKSAFKKIKGYLLRNQKLRQEEDTRLEKTEF